MNYNGFINWYGDSEYTPNKGGRVRVQLRNGFITEDFADDLDWEHRPRNGFPNETDIVGYEVTYLPEDLE